MQNKPKVAIVTRTRKRNHLLKRAIQSVLQQSMPDWHHWIVNDGGDATLLEEVLADYGDDYAGRYSLLHVDHAGMQTAANTAIAESDSAYIAIHDDDDSWHADFLKETTAYLDEKGPDSKYRGVITKTERILEVEQPEGGFREVARKPYVPLDIISLGRLGYENPFPPIAFVYRRSVLDQVDTYNAEWELVADLDFNFRFLRRYEIGVIDKVLSYYHWRKDAGSRESLNTVTIQAARHEQLLNELKNHYLRNVDSPGDSTIALAFLISSYAVENQWMTSEVRDHTLSTQKSIEDLAGGLKSLHRFNDKSLWPKIEELSELLHLTNTANVQLEELRKFNNDTTWPKLEQLSQLLHLASEANGQLQELRKFNNESVWPKLEENENKNQEIHDKLEEIHSVLEPAGSLSSAIGKIAATLDSQEARQQQIVKQQENLEQCMKALQGELESLREENRRTWKLGPLRFKRVDAKGGKDSKSSPE